ncbi:MAG: winged helix-turn-helix transcriptional regulator, partial [Myxococcales bacterium]|nr:winged helix-turn-helix transcriptional regulator [Myxococcales bacterium]
MFRGATGRTAQGRESQRGPMQAAGTGDARELLTPRQLEVLELLARGLTNREIAGVLGISPGTAKVHVSAVIEALDVSNRTEAAMVLHELRAGADGEQKPDAEAPSRGGVPGFGARPAIAILPFDDLSAESPDAFFADALVEDLTTAMAAFRWFPVIARNSAWSYRGRALEMTQVSQELGARYLVEGSVRRSKDRVRIHVQLIDGTSGEHLLAEKLDRPLDEALALQDEIVESIVGALAPTLLRVEGMRALRRPVASLDAWERFQRAMGLLARYGAAEGEQAIALLDGVIADEPE